MKKIFILVVILLISFLMVSLNNFNDNSVKSVSGRVFDKKTKELLSGVKITSSEYETYTDFDGNFSIPVTGKHVVISVDLISYPKLDMDLDIISDTTVSVGL